MISRAKPRLIWGCLRSSRPIIKKGREEKGTYSIYQQREHRQSRQTHAQKHMHTEPKCGDQNPQNHTRTTKQKHITLLYNYIQPQARASPRKHTAEHTKQQNIKSNTQQGKNQLKQVHSLVSSIRKNTKKNTDKTANDRNKYPSCKNTGKLKYKCPKGHPFYKPTQFGHLAVPAKLANGANIRQPFHFYKKNVTNQNFKNKIKKILLVEK